MKSPPRNTLLLFSAMWLVAILAGAFACSATSSERLSISSVSSVEKKPNAARIQDAAPVLPTAVPEPTRVQVASPLQPTALPLPSKPVIISITPVAPDYLVPRLDTGADQPPPRRVNPNSITGSQVFSDNELFIHLPPKPSHSQPVRVLLVLHGIGARGQPFADSLCSEAERNNWLLIAPNLPYRDYMEVQQLMEDDLKITRILVDTLDSLPTRLNLKIKNQVLVYGFSRGGQLAHRFALFYPNRVGSVVAMSAGSYTLPTETRKSNLGTSLLPFPFGVGDLDKHLGRSVDWQNLKRVSFWIAVGEKDNYVSDVPRAFDPYLGDNRVDRARSFEQSLRASGIDARLVIFPNAGHEVTGEMRKSAVQYLRDRELANNFD